MLTICPCNKSLLNESTKSKTRIVVDVAQQLVSEGHIPTCIVMLVKDLMAYRQRSNVATGMNSVMKEDRERCYINVLFHNKGMDMISLDKILGSKRVMAALPKHLRGPPPIVSYTYTKTIGVKYSTIERQLMN